MEFLVTALFLLAAAGLFRDGDSRRDLSAGLLWFVAGYCGGHGTLQLCNGDHRPRTDAARLSLQVAMIRFGGHLPKGEYDVDDDGHAGQADAAELHG